LSAADKSLKNRGVVINQGRACLILDKASDRLILLMPGLFRGQKQARTGIV
jgi:hypothetical protein